MLEKASLKLANILTTVKLSLVARVNQPLVNPPEVLHGVVEEVRLDRLQVGRLPHEVDVVRPAVVDPDVGHF